MFKYSPDNRLTKLIDKYLAVTCPCSANAAKQVCFSLVKNNYVLIERNLTLNAPLGDSRTQM